MKAGLSLLGADTAPSPPSQPAGHSAASASGPSNSTAADILSRQAEDRAEALTQDALIEGRFGPLSARPQGMIVRRRSREAASLIRGTVAASEAFVTAPLKPSYAGQVGRAIWGEVVGTVQGLFGIVTGLVNLVVHPIKTVEGIVDAVVNWRRTLRNFVEPFVSGDVEAQGRVVGNIFGNIIGGEVLGPLLVRGVGFLGRAGGEVASRAIGVAGRAGELATSTIGRIGELAKGAATATGEAIGKTSNAAGELISRTWERLFPEELPAAESGVQPVGGRIPINSKYAGQTYPVEKLPPDLQVKYPNSVQFKPSGFPDYSPYSKAEVRINGLTGDYTHDEAMANKATGLTETPKGYVWHHVEDGKTLQLVPKDLHAAVPHTGGAAVIRSNAANAGSAANDSGN